MANENKALAFDTMDQIRAWGAANAGTSQGFSARLKPRDTRWPAQPVTIRYSTQARLMDQDEVWQREMGGAL